MRQNGSISFFPLLLWCLVTTIELFCFRRSFAERRWEYVRSYQPLESARVLERRSAAAAVLCAALVLSPDKRSRM